MCYNFLAIWGQIFELDQLAQVPINTADAVLANSLRVVGFR